MLELTWLDETDLTFPPVEMALDDPNGLLAAGGDLSPERLVTAYRQGIFPWFEEGQPPLWWSPTPRMVLFPDELHVPRSLAKILRRESYKVTCDKAFEGVISACAAPRDDDSGTWITEEMIDAYCHLHELGIAHSVEAWQGDELVGGFYGIQLDRAFFGESMFAKRPDASKVAFVKGVQLLQAQGCRIIDCQVTTDHLSRFGAREISRGQFCDLLIDCIQELSPSQSWHL